ncbi:MAG: hypothetical protein R3E39_05420 [Anaerolineae bacterium]
MTQPDTLYRLQEIEIGIQARHKRLEEIASSLANNELVQQAQQQVANVKQVLSPLQTRSKNLELEIKSNATKIKETDEALYSGRVRNPKELQDMQHEIELLKKRNLELEDLLLETMVAVETTEAELDKRETNLQQAIEEHETANHHLIEERTRIKSEGSLLVKNREAVLLDVTPESLQTYNNLKVRKNNQPVALLVNQSCTACRVQQDLAVVTEARKGQKLVFCASCGRILAYRSG